MEGLLAGCRIGFPEALELDAPSASRRPTTARYDSADRYITRPGYVADTPSCLSLVVAIRPRRVAPDPMAHYSMPTARFTLLGRCLLWGQDNHPQLVGLRLP
jgi:hypothetical protein